MRRKRSNDEYIIEAGQKLLKVLQVLSHAPSLGLTVADVANQTDFTQDFCRRALITLESCDFARSRNKGWRLGSAALALSDVLIDQVQPNNQ